MRLVGHVECKEEIRNVRLYNILVRKPEGNRTFGRYTSGLENNINIYIQTTCGVILYAMSIIPTASGNVNTVTGESVFDCKTSPFKLVYITLVLEGTEGLR
jgi:hypothetical protein